MKVELQAKNRKIEIKEEDEDEYEQQNEEEHPRAKRRYPGRQRRPVRKFGDSSSDEQMELQDDDESDE